ncbi:MAG TPA: FHA domain-containing protein [Planctomycetaceae bacterium]|nr:FHA domain-containing protein [Planctomycetaceae bacterium]
MHGQLLPVLGGDPIPLLKTHLIIGRRERCDIVLNYPSISSQHAELDFQDGYWTVRDLHSVNGTQVNGKWAMKKILRPGDTIAFARYAFEIAYALDPAAPLPEEPDPFGLSLLEKAGIAGNNRGRSQRPSATDSSKPKSDTPPPKPADAD